MPRSAGTGFVEPARLRRSRWGRYGVRYGAGLALLGIAVVTLQFTSAYSFLLYPVGSALFLLGWVALPGALWRRWALAVPALGAAWIIYSGPDFATAWTVILAAWLLARQRPLLSWSALLLPLTAGIIAGNTFSQYSDNVAVFALMAAATVAGAWAARFLAAARQSRLQRNSSANR